jgi:hypothetical protein
LFVHGEDFSFPVQAGTDSSQLVLNTISMGFFELPNLFNELFSAQIVSGFTLIFHELLFNNCLGSDTGMIRSRQVKSFKALHSFSSNDGILNGNSERMADVKVSSDVGRGKGDSESFGVGSLIIGMEELVGVPPLIPVLFD